MYSNMYSICTVNSMITGYALVQVHINNTQPFWQEQLQYIHDTEADLNLLLCNFHNL